MNMNWTELQDAIAQDYCGTVLMLDDEILKAEKDGTQLTPLFLNLKRAFENKGMLCDLRQIDDDFAKTQSIDLITKQIKQADTIVVDWYLGTGKDQVQDPINALIVLRKLVDIGGFRFVIVHTKASAERVIARLKSEFGEAFKPILNGNVEFVADDESSKVVAEDSPSESPTASPTPSTYLLADSVYLSVIPKEEGTPNAASVMGFFVDGLRKVFPDHLHWAGLEFAARTKSVLPNLLIKLPSSTDTALIFQSLTQENGDELADCIAECLVLEMRQLLSQTPLAAVSDETLLSRLRESVLNNKDVITREFSGRAHLWQKAWDSQDLRELKKSCVENNEQRYPASHASFFPAVSDSKPGSPGLKKQAPELNRFISAALAVTPSEVGHFRYAALREHLQCATLTRLEPGVILQRKGTAESGQSAFGKNEWLLCISPACDCARGDYARRYLFVGGETTTTHSNMQTCIRVNDSICFVKWKRSEVYAVECSTVGPSEYKMITKLHEPFAQKVTQQVWGHQTRIGVSTSDYLRKLRNE